MARIATENAGTSDASNPAHRRRLGYFLKRVLRHERLLFWALVIVHLIPIWAFKYLPTTDGPAHLANADVMRRINEAGPVGEVFRKYYYISGTPSPNLAGHLILAGLMYMVPAIIAEKLVLSLYVVLLPLGMRYAARRIRPRATSIAFLAFPMTYSFLLGQGFYNFCLSLAAFLFTVGYWFGHRSQMNARRALGLFGLAMVLYVCHLFSLMMACGVIGMMAGWFVVVAWRKGDKAAVRSQIRMALITGAALLPAVLPAAIFRPSTHVPWLNHDIGKSSLREDLLGLLQFQTMVSYRKSEALLGSALVAIFAALTLFALMAKARKRARSAWDVLLIAPIGLAIVYLRASDATSIHFYIPPRVMYYAFLIMVLWLAAQPFPRVVRGAVPLFCGVLALGFAERGHELGSESRSTRSARAACIRFPACRQTTDCGPSMTSALTSSPRCAGRQCMKITGSLAAFISAASIVQPAKARRRSSRSSSWPIDVHTSL